MRSDVQLLRVPIQRLAERVAHSRAPPQTIDESLQIVRQRRFELESLARRRMLECQPRRVQRQPWCAAGIVESRSIQPFTIQRIAADKVTRFGQVNSNLVRSPGLQHALDN